MLVIINNLGDVIDIDHILCIRAKFNDGTPDFTREYVVEYEITLTGSDEKIPLTLDEYNQFIEKVFNEDDNTGRNSGIN